MQRRAFVATVSAATASAALAALAMPALAGTATPTPYTIILDWFINPDHAPLFAAKYSGAFARAGLNVILIAPTDPDLPPRLVAAGKADGALSYQPQLYTYVDAGMKLRRTATLINKPLTTLTALGASGIKTLADLKGKKIGYSVVGMDTIQIASMLKTVGLKLSDVALVNVNFNLVTSLRAKEVDAVIGTYRTNEDIQLAQAGLNPVIFYPEDHGVPTSEELILLTAVPGLKNPALPRFLAALKEGVAALAADPEKILAQFLHENPTLNDKLNIASWHALPPYFASNPAALNAPVYLAYRDFLAKGGIIKHPGPLSDYAVQVTA